MLGRLQMGHSQKENNKLEGRTEGLIHLSAQTDKNKYGRAVKKHERLIEKFQYLSNMNCKKKEWRKQQKIK